jgi:hypothetical protein
VGVYVCVCVCVRGSSTSRTQRDCDIQARIRAHPRASPRIHTPTHLVHVPKLHQNLVGLEGLEGLEEEVGGEGLEEGLVEGHAAGLEGAAAGALARRLLPRRPGGEGDDLGLVGPVAKGTHGLWEAQPFVPHVLGGRLLEHGGGWGAGCWWVLGGERVRRWGDSSGLACLAGWAGLRVLSPCLSRVTLE